MNTKQLTRIFILVIALLATIDVAAFAQRRGGGGRGGGGRGGGGRGGYSGGAGRNYSSRSSARPSVSSRPSSRPSQRPSQRPNRGNVNTGDRTNNIGDRNNINVDRDTDVNINGDGDNWGGCCDYDHPIGAGIVAGAVVGAAAAATYSAGTVVYALPPSCTTVDVGGVLYNECDGTYYSPQFDGSTASYVVVEDPH